MRKKYQYCFCDRLSFHVEIDIFIIKIIRFFSLDFIQQRHCLSSNTIQKKCVSYFLLLFEAWTQLIQKGTNINKLSLSTDIFHSTIFNYTRCLYDSLDRLYVQTAYYCYWCLSPYLSAFQTLSSAGMYTQNVSISKSRQNNRYCRMTWCKLIERNPADRLMPRA